MKLLKKKTYSLFEGDCLEIMFNIEDKVDLILTDPPYNIGEFSKSRNMNIQNMHRSNFVLEGWDNISSNDFDKLMDSFLNLSAQKLKNKGALLVFCSFFKIGKIVEMAQKYNFYFKSTGVWHKTNPMPRNMNLHFVASNEAWLYFIYNGKTGTFNNDNKLILDFFETPVVSVAEKREGKHPTQKPIKLMESFVKLLSNEGEIVLDPFMGSGTVGLACRNLSRRFIGIELNADYFDTASKRLKGE